jgi:hypothetical protein
LHSSRRALKFIDAGIQANRRPDGLYHAYNLFELSADRRSIAIGRLPLMLEGQVAVLSSGLPSPSEAAELVEAMFESPLYRADQQSFLLYPERPVVAFLDRGHIAPERVASNPLLAALAEAGDRTLIVRDADGEYRFAPTFRKDDHVREALTRLQSNRRYAALVDAHGASVLQTYESVFHHSSFTGRSGSMFGYEGIGCIYWHMGRKTDAGHPRKATSTRATWARPHPPSA